MNIVDEFVFVCLFVVVCVCGLIYLGFQTVTPKLHTALIPTTIPSAPTDSFEYKIYRKTSKNRKTFYFLGVDGMEYKCVLGAK